VDDDFRKADLPLTELNLGATASMAVTASALMAL
jgi:hypothetical protein